MSTYRRIRLALLGLLAVPGLLLVAAPPAAATTATVGATDCSPLPLHPGQFPDSPKVDNRFQPMVPGTQFFLDGTVVDDNGVAHPHRIATTVTDLTKVVDGVRAIVVFDVDIQDAVVTESELFFV